MPLFDSSEMFPIYFSLVMNVSGMFAVGVHEKIHVGKTDFANKLIRLL